MRLTYTSASHRYGLGLIELLIALVIGLVLVLGVVSLHQRSSAVSRTTETVARLQEVARLAFDVLEADVRMAGFWGLHNRAAAIVNRAASGTTLPAPFTATQATRIDFCGGSGSNWAIDLDAYVDGSNNAYSWPCAAVGGAAAGTDTLVVRRAADERPAALEADRIYVQTSRLEGALFVAAATCLRKNARPRRSPWFDPSSPPGERRHKALSRETDHGRSPRLLVGALTAHKQFSWNGMSRERP